MRELAKMVIVLAVICGLSGFSLSYLKQTTAPLIEAQVLARVQAPALAAIYSAAENDPVAERQRFDSPSGTITVFPYRLKDKLVAVALEAKSKGYGGDMGVMVGFDVERDVLLGIKITEMKETAGIGTLVDAPKFASQFTNSGLAVDLKSKGGAIDAVSGATISSTATVGAVQKAAAQYQAIKAHIVETWK